MMTADQLLSSNATELERALADVLSSNVFAEPRGFVDPVAAPVEWLPFLAENESVDLWYGDWTDARKRQMIANATRLAALKGTRAAAPEFLAYVDGILLDKISYPRRFVMGRAIIGRTPIGHPAFVARHLVKVETRNPPQTFVVGRGVLGRSILRTPSREPLKRCLDALRIAKSPETESRVDFAHMRHLRLSDAVPLDGTYRLGQYLDRIRL